ncbi:hypothetical protein [Nannocystis sp. SCPEA4]|uniref:hypothetical protein n=1 Tax=Nannocystis sp. SCPEA4 TaxID=2996787 RepID=UPI002270E8D3|nr:hypothetical protein [Nannocystis sp. SCPEA4]MCY1056799.1 hypothetical protein [Nannocystis sp. SCPEA4]
MTMIAATCLMSACGPEKNTTTDSEPTSGGSTMTGTEAPTTGASICESYLSEEDDSTAMTITIVNTGAVPLWLDAVGCEGVPAMHIAGDAGENLYIGADPCPIPECEELMQGDCVRDCFDCGQPWGIRLDPGTSLGVLWSASDGETMQMTAECGPGANCPGECVAGRVRPAGTYEITVTAYTECAGDCECAAADPELGCALGAEVDKSQPLVVIVPFEHPQDTVVEIPIGA